MASLQGDVFRAVILTRTPGATTKELKQYTRSDGVTIDYHDVRVIGPYSTRGSAKGQATAQSRWHTDPHLMDVFVEKVPGTAWEVC